MIEVIMRLYFVLYNDHLMYKYLIACISAYVRNSNIVSNALKWLEG